MGEHASDHEDGIIRVATTDGEGKRTERFNLNNSLKYLFYFNLLVYIKIILKT